MDFIPYTDARIVIVDDDDFFRELSSRVLKANTYCTVYAFNTGENLLEKLERINPDIVFLDYKLNSKDKQAQNGLKILKQILKDKPTLKVIMMSGNENLDLLISANQLGASGYIFKNHHSLNSMVQYVVNSLNNY